VKGWKPVPFADDEVIPATELSQSACRLWGSKIPVQTPNFVYAFGGNVVVALYKDNQFKVVVLDKSQCAVKEIPVA